MAVFLFYTFAELILLLSLNFKVMLKFANSVTFCFFITSIQQNHQSFKINYHEEINRLFRSSINRFIQCFICIKWKSHK